SDSQDLNRTIDTLVSREGLTLGEAMEAVLPPIVEEIRSLPEDLHAFYMYLRQTMGPYAQGPVALIARHAHECVFSADAMGLLPPRSGAAPAGAARARGRLGVQLRARRRPRRQEGLGADAAGAGREVPGADRPRGPPLDPAPARRDAAHRQEQLAAPQRGRGGR